MREIFFTDLACTNERLADACLDMVAFGDEGGFERLMQDESPESRP